MVIKGIRVGPFLKKTFREIGEDNLPMLAASAAYNLFFSVFPLLLFLGPVVGLVANKQRVIGFIMAQLTSVVPAEVAPAIRQTLERVVFSSNAPGLMSIGLLLAAWSGSNIFGTLMGALNTAYDVEETRPWLQRQIIRLGAFVGGGIILTLSTLVFLDGERIANWIGGMLHLHSFVILAWTVLQFPLAVAGLVGLAFVTFYLLPNVHQRKRHVLVAAVITTLLWIAATLLFRLYIKNFPPNPAYGLIGGVIILLTWMYYTMFVVLVGGELASEMHVGTGSLAPDKGAIYFGRIVSSGREHQSVDRGN